MTTPPRVQKLAFWLLLGLFSAALAEVVSGSSPFVLFTPWGLLVTLPVYLLHAVFLAGVVYWYSGNLRLGSLYLAGALFGLYEAYVTKVLWAPTWDPIPVTVGGVYVFETASLVLLWHPLLSFVAPLLMAETLCTRSRLVLDGLPPRIGAAIQDRRVRVGGVVLVGGFQGTVYPDTTTALLSAAGTAAVLVLAVVAWRQLVGPERYAAGELLPAGRELLAVGGLLAVLYVALGLVLRPEQLPGLGAQATVWGLYLVFGGLFVLQLRRDRYGPSPTHPSRTVPLRALATHGGTYLLAVGVASVVLRPVAAAAFVGLYVAALAVGAAMLVWIVRGFRWSSVGRT